MSDLKTLNLNLETNLHRQQNKKTQQTEQRATSRQPTDSIDQERERKENTKTQGMKEINKKICYACESDNHEIKDCDSGKNIFIIDRASRQIKKEELKYRLEEYGKAKCIKIRQDKYGRLGNIGMACFETKEEANIAIQDLNEATRYIAREYEPKKQRININSQNKTNTITAKEKEKRNLFNTVTTEHIAQKTQSTNRSEQNKEKRVNNITSTGMGKARRTGIRE